MNREDSHMRSVLTLVGALVLVVSLNASVCAYPISIKTSFITSFIFSPQYSLDGQKYYPVGMRARGLRDIMIDHPLRVQELDRYQSRELVTEITGGLGGGLIG